MAVIFSASSDQMSFPHSSRIIAPLVRWLWPGASDAAVHDIVVCVRKGGHLAEFAILALLIWRALAKPVRGTPLPWRWSMAVRTVLFVLLYAASDEFHQLFVPSREASVWDVMIDTIGGVVGLLVLWVLGRWRGWWREAAEGGNQVTGVTRVR
jgi:hypothetical protein